MKAPCFLLVKQNSNKLNGYSFVPSKYYNTFVLCCMAKQTINEYNDFPKQTNRIFVSKHIQKSFDETSLKILLVRCVRLTLS